MGKNILLTSIGGDIGQSVLRCLTASKEKNLIVGCDMDSFAAPREQIDFFYTAPAVLNYDEYIDFLKKVVKKHAIESIFPISEAEIEFFDAHRELMAGLNADVFIHEHNILAVFLDKYQTAKFFEKHNIPHPRTCLLKDYKGQMAFPVILKPRRGYGRKNNAVISDKYELRYFKKKMPDSILQEIVGTRDEEYTVGIFSDGRKVHSIAFKRYLGYGSLTKIAHLVVDSVIDDLAHRLAETIGLIGPINVQMRKTNTGFVLLEINPRLSSTVYMRHFFGFKDTQWWLDLKNGREIRYKPEFREGTAVKTVGEVFFNLCRS